MAQYRTGTISIETGSAIVTGSGTAFLSAGILPGNSLKVEGHLPVMTIQSVDGEGQVTLTAPWTGNAVANEGYQISRDFTPLNGIQEINIGDRDWPVHLTQGLRVIDQRLGEVGDDEVISGTPKVVTFSDKQGNVYKFQVTLQS